MKKLAIITTHPIQYNSPLFRLLSERKRIEIKVFYTWGQSKGEVFDVRFGLKRSWDVPLLEGYTSEFVRNTSCRPDSNHFWGVLNPGLYKQIIREGYDAVLIYRWSLFSHFYLMQRLGKNPALFFRGDSHLLQTSNGVKQYLKCLFLKFVYRNVDGAFVVGALNKAYMQANGLEEKKLFYAPHAVDNERFTNEAIAMEERAMKERDHAGIPSDAVVFLYAGKFYALKQLEFLVRTFQQLVGEQYRLLLVGNGDEETMLKNLAGTDKRILFQSFRNQSEMPWVYRIGDIFVLPSKSETWGLGVNEAMACARAAIVSDQCGCAPDLIKENENGFVFQSGNKTDLLRCLKAVPDKTVAHKMGKKAFETIKDFSLDRIAQTIEDKILSNK
ncbi:glycosyltransferase family 4 protein [Lacibacter sp. H375]|uniref:glycosyltransferase family 4 protein n=1 Tax=Lacibacter sp. H375 TaxID=3133424 RepID=UPI0030C47EB6